MMTISPGFVGKEARDAVGIQLFILLAAGVGIAFLVVGVRLGAWGLVLLGDSFVVTAASFRLCLFGRRRLDKRVREAWGADGVEIRIGLRPHRPLSLLCNSVGMTMMFGAGAMVVESLAARILMGVLSTLPLLLLPDSLRALSARGREIVLSSRTLTYRGWSYDAEVPWDVISHVGRGRWNPWVPAIRFDVDPVGTTSVTRHKLLAWLEPPPQPDHVEIPVLAVDMPVQLRALARELASRGLSDRSGYLAHHGSETLTDELMTV